MPVTQPTEYIFTEIYLLNSHTFHEMFQKRIYTRKLRNQGRETEQIISVICHVTINFYCI